MLAEKMKLASSSVLNKAENDSDIFKTDIVQSRIKKKVVKRNAISSKIIVSSDSEEDLFEDDIDKRKVTKDREKIQTKISSQFLNTTASLVPEKKLKLGPDWFKGNDRKIQTIHVTPAPPPDFTNELKKTESMIKIKKKDRPKKADIDNNAMFLESFNSTFNNNSSINVVFPSIGQILKGKVASIQNYGVFVNLPSPYQNGFVHISQITFNRIKSADSILHIHQEVYVKVIQITLQESGKITVDLSIKYCDQVSGFNHNINVFL